MPPPLTLHQTPWYAKRRRLRTSVKSRHRCYICGAEVRGGKRYDAHITDCLVASTAMMTPDETGREQHPARHRSFILELDAWEGYRMIVQVPGVMKLSVLDQFLRKTWMDCCGGSHGSCFLVPAPPQFLREFNLTLSGDDGIVPFNMGKKVSHYIVLSDPMILDVFGKTGGHHEKDCFAIGYEFDGRRILVVRLVTSATCPVPVKGTEGEVRLLMRNLQRQQKCGGCGQFVDVTSLFMCPQCGEEDNMDVFYCAANVECHAACDHGASAWKKVVNSPRMGMCHYTGPSDEVSEPQPQTGRHSVSDNTNPVKKVKRT